MDNKFVKIVEVGPRDGLQNESHILPTQTKFELIEKLCEAGLSYIEATSFVRPTAIPQMSDSVELFEQIQRDLSTKFSDVCFPVLVPNLKGLENAVKAGAKEIALFTATSDTFTKKNINCTVEESFERFKVVVQLANEKNIKVRGYVSTAFYCPYEGKINFSKTLEVSQKLIDMGAYEVSIGDTIGMASPDEVEELIKLLETRISLNKIAMHFHDTRGMAIANILRSLDLGIRSFDSSIAGLGGCPYADGASGNVATEEVNFLLERLGYRTNVDQSKLYKAGLFAVKQLGKKKISKLLQTI